MDRKFHYCGAGSVYIVEEISSTSSNVCEACDFRKDGHCILSDYFMDKPIGCGHNIYLKKVDTNSDPYFTAKFEYNGHKIRAIRGSGCNTPTSCVFKGCGNCTDKFVKYNIDGCGFRIFVNANESNSSKEILEEKEEEEFLDEFTSVDNISSTCITVDDKYYHLVKGVGCTKCAFYNNSTCTKPSGIPTCSAFTNYQQLSTPIHVTPDKAYICVGPGSCNDCCFQSLSKRCSRPGEMRGCSSLSYFLKNICTVKTHPALLCPVDEAETIYLGLKHVPEQMNGTLYVNGEINYACVSTSKPEPPPSNSTLVFIEETKFEL